MLYYYTNRVIIIYWKNKIYWPNTLYCVINIFNSNLKSIKSIYKKYKYNKKTE